MYQFVFKTDRKIFFNLSLIIRYSLFGFAARFVYRYSVGFLFSREPVYECRYELRNRNRLPKAVKGHERLQIAIYFGSGLSWLGYARYSGSRAI
jgi:hypothetical protein